jgi:Multiubiquitin
MVSEPRKESLMADRESATDVEQHRPLHIEVIIDRKPYTFHMREVTGKEIKDKAGIPDPYSLYRRRPGGNEPISDTETVKLHDGENFFSRPPSNVS